MYILYIYATMKTKVEGLVGWENYEAPISNEYPPRDSRA